MLIIVGAASLAAAVIGAVIFAGAADYLLRTPAWLRTLLWFVGIGAILVAIRRRVVPAVRFRPSLTDVALRIERSELGRRAGLPGMLASGLELGGSPDAPLASGLVRETGTKFGAIAGGALLAPARVLRAAGLLALVLIVLVVMWAATPTLASIGLRRVVMPWAGAEWPKRTEVADATSTSPHARGSGFVLRAILKNNPTLLSGAAQATQERVVGRFRLLVNGVPAPTRRVLMTKQRAVADTSQPVTGREPNGSADASTAGLALPANASLYEYLIEPWGMTASTTPGQERVELEYWFESDDDATKPSRVLLVEPPAILRASFKLTPPAYFTASESTAAALPVAATGTSRIIELGAGVDERAVPKPILRGAGVEVAFELNKPVPMPTGEDRMAWIDRTFGSDIGELLRRAASGGPAAAVTLDGMILRTSWTMDTPVRLNVMLTDEHGISNVEASTYYLDALVDKPAQASVTLPTEDKSVLPTATVDIRGEGRDDVGLRSISLWRQIARSPVDSSGAPAEPLGESVQMVRNDATNQQPTSPDTSGVTAAVAPSGDTSAAGMLFGVPSPFPLRLEVNTALDLRSLNVVAGDEVWLTAQAIDGYSLAGESHEPGVSSVRRLRIISEEQFLEQVWSELAGVRRSAISMADEQARLRSDTSRNAEASRLERAQASISDRIAREREAVREVEQRLRDNGFDDDEMQAILRDAADSLEQAGKASGEAGSKLNQAKQSEQQGGAPDDAARDAAERSQAQSQRRLEDLAERLDQGEDTWSMKRSIEQLLEEQKALRAQTAQIGSQTTGRAEKDLSPQERAALSDASQQQQGLAQRASEAIQKMMDSEENVRKNDPAAADAMNQATRQAQRDQLEQKMQEAAQQVQQNQTNTAQSRQSQAIDSMEQMLEQMKNTAKNRDEVLRRQLASLIESLEALIQDQESQLDALTLGILNNQVKGLDRGMARLHQNTLAVLDEAQQASREIAPVAELIDLAATAQQQAVVALRVEPINADEAQDQEVVSLDKLKEAKAKAEELDRDAQNRQAQRKRAELKKAYTEALTQQLALRQQADALVGVERTRRTRAEARTVGEGQAALQDTLAKLLADNPELAEAVMFSYAHKRLDDAMGRAAAALAEGGVDRSVVRHQDRAVKVLQSLVQALDESNQKDDEFRQEEQQQPGNGNQNQNGRTPLVPQAADVKVLRMMQEEALELTREAGEQNESALVNEAADLQTDLATQAEALIKKLLERRRQGPGSSPADDTKPADENPKPAEPPPAGVGALFDAAYAHPRVLAYSIAQPDPKPAQPTSPASKPATPPAPVPSPAPESKPLPPSVPPTPPPTDTKPSAQPADAPPKKPADPGIPSLDDLLGTGDSTRPGDPSPVDPLDPAAVDLDRLLSGAEIGDAFRQAVTLMGDASKRLKEGKDASLTTQRVQESIVRRLDQLLSSLEQMQQQQQSSSSQQQQQQQQQPQNVPQQQSQSQRNEENQGDHTGQVVEPPGRKDGAIRPGLEAVRSAWGQLPDRVRDLLVQGSSDRFSSLYESMTEAYYKKLAEQGKSR